MENVLDRQNDSALLASNVLDQDDKELGLEKLHGKQEVVLYLPDDNLVTEKEDCVSSLDSAAINEHDAQKYFGNSSTSQEFFVLNQETGEYQKYIYIPPTDEGEKHTKKINGDLDEYKVNEKSNKDSSFKQDKFNRNENRSPEIQISNSDFHILDGEQKLEVCAERKLDSNHSDVTHEENSSVKNIQCKKCPGRYFKTEEFDDHCIQYYVKDKVSLKHSGSTLAKEKKCEICQKKIPRKDYLTHLKDDHTNVLFQCPLCTQSYHSPELLNVHYNHFHLDENNQARLTEPSSESNEKILNKDIRFKQEFVDEG